MEKTKKLDASATIREVLIHSFIDPRGAADFKAITVFVFAAVFVLSLPVGLAFGKWLPDIYLNYIFAIILSGFGTDLAQNIQAIRSEAPAPEPAKPAIAPEILESLKNEPLTN